MKKIIYSIIIIIALCLIASWKLIFPSRCYGMIDGLRIIFFSFLILIFVSIILFLDIHNKVKHDRPISLLPYLTLFISVAVISLFVYLQSEKFKSKVILEGQNSYRGLILRENYKYELIDKLPEMGCTESGQYRISNDTIYLTEEPEITKTLYINEKFYIDSTNELIIPISNDSLNNKKEDYFRIVKNHAP